MQCGSLGEDDDTTVFLRWSDDYGQSWGMPVAQTLGATGQYKATPQWNRLGQARYRVFELSWACDRVTALNGGFLPKPVVSRG
jgi:hypothetical protein